MRTGLVLICFLTSPFAYASIDEEITVVGTRTERSLEEVAATVSVRTSDDIERELTRNIADLVRFEPGVTVGGTGDRFGLGGFSIRGIGGNRVLTIVDGVRIADEFSFGPFLSSRRDFIDVDSLQRAEIARGPVSSLYGSDALGGVVALTTKSPSNYLEAANFYAGFKGGYSGSDDSKLGSVTLAGGNSIVSGMLMATQREASAQKTYSGDGGDGPKREAADPQNINTDSLLFKLALSPADAHKFGFTADLFKNETNTAIRSDYGTVSRGTLVNSRVADDERERARYSLTYDYEGDLWFADRVNLLGYHQNSETTQLTTENRTPPIPGSLDQIRTRDSRFEQEINGVLLQAHKLLKADSMSHQLVIGIDYYETNNESIRNGATADVTGRSVREFSPLPTRDFPITEVQQFALFLQDEIELLDGRLILSPGLRYDKFSADTNPDALYFGGNPGVTQPVDFEDSALTGKLGAVYRLTDYASFYANYSEGFRAPPYDDVNVGFTNFLGGYKTISNANLESETSAGVELGFRLNARVGSLNFALFKTDYENFIEELAIAPGFLSTGGVDPTDGLLTFQSVNLSNVVIQGAELSGELDLSVMSTALAGFNANAAIAYADGENATSSQPLDSVEPLTLVMGLGYDNVEGRWGGSVVWTVVDGKEQSDIDPSSIRKETSGYGTVDLLGYFRFGDNVTVNAGLFNVTDKEYVRWADTIAIDGDAVRRFTQPGFNAAINIRVEL